MPFRLDGVYRAEETSAHVALREALVNMLTNADYSSNRGVVCRWTDVSVFSEGLSERESIAYAIARERGRVTTKALAEAVGIGRQTASNILKGMAERGVLVWHGNSMNDPSQHYTARKLGSNRQ